MARSAGEPGLARGRHLEARESEEDLGAVGALLGGKEDDGARGEGARGQREESRLALVLVLRLEANKLLLQRVARVVDLVHLNMGFSSS